MEKIYMDDNDFDNQNNQQKQKQPQKGKYHFSIILSFVVAIMAIASLVVVGFDQISYAADNEAAVEDSITMYRGAKGSSLLWMHAIYNGNEFAVPLLYSDSNYTKPVFCIEHVTSINLGSDNALSGSYNRDRAITDDGILYILRKSSWYGGDGILVNNVDNEKNKYLEIYGTQIALWMYLYDTRYNNSDYNGSDKELHAISGNSINVIKNATDYDVRTNNETIYGSLGTNGNLTDGNTKVYATISTVVADAKSYDNSKILNVKFDDGENISEVTNSDDYQTSGITVSGVDLINYSISVSGIDGAFFVNADAERVDNTSDLSPTDKLFVRFPKSSVSDQVQNLTVTVNGTFDNFLTGVEYIRTDSQKIVTVNPERISEEKKATIPIVGAPDTGMSKAKTIYFIGLIVLLCGIGIIYASSKPIKEN